MHGQVLSSKFVLCPPGLGADSYRIWEVLYLGAIPVVERTGGGWDDIFLDLPVLLVDDFGDVTQELLEASYPRLLARCGAFSIFAKHLRRLRNHVASAPKQQPKKTVDHAHAATRARCSASLKW